ncbi:MAG: hypothetical protein R3Y63_10860 [Eubacteriales bacterium]
MKCHVWLNFLFAIVVGILFVLSRKEQYTNEDALELVVIFRDISHGIPDTMMIVLFLPKLY